MLKKINKIYFSLSIIFGFILFGFMLAGKVFAHGSGLDDLPVNLGVAGIAHILYVVAFAGGALMILAPCSAATIPAYFANTFGSKKKITERTTIFFLGFSVVYAFMGGGASLVGRFLNLYQDEVTLIAGILLVIFGLLAFTGRNFFSFYRPKSKTSTATAGGTFLFGTLFAVGFTGCSGPVLAGILTVASQLPTIQAVLLMFFYSLGIGVPLIILSLVFDRYNILDTKFFRWHFPEFKLWGKKVRLSLTNALSGLLLLALGVVFIIYRSTGVLIAAFPRKITDIGYAVQDWLLAKNLPSFLDTLFLIIIIFALIKFAAMLFVERQKEGGLQIHFNFKKIKNALIAIVVLLFLFNTFVYLDKKSSLEKKLAQVKEQSRPADIEITTIVNKDCPECYDISSFINFLEKKNVNIVKKNGLDWQDKGAQELIKKYNITRIPSVVVKGEINKSQELQNLWQSAGKIKEGDFIFNKTFPPYTDVASGKIRGKFKVTYLTDKSCEDCYDTTLHKQALANLGMKAISEQTVDTRSTEGRKLIRDYNIRFVPTLLLWGDLDVYDAFKQVWPQVGSVADDGTYVFDKGIKIMGTYKDLRTGKVVKAVSPAAKSSQNKAVAGKTEDKKGEQPKTGDAIREIRILGTEFKFDPSNITVKKGEKIKLIFTNTGNTFHDFTIDELGVKTKTLRSGESETVEFTPNRSGTFSFYCSIPGHRAAGMEGSITVE